MPTTRGLGRYLGAIGDTADLIGRGDIFPTEAPPLVVADWFFPPGPPAPVKIPYSWLFRGLRERPDKPFTTAAVSHPDGDVATATDQASQREYGNNPFTATLATGVRADLTNLCTFMLAFYATQAGQVPRARYLALTLNLFGRTQAEQWTIMGLAIGTRITITGAPTDWPQGATEQVIEGVRQVVAARQRLVILNTAPVVGTTPGVAGPWLRTDVSNLAALTDTMPF